MRIFFSIISHGHFETISKLKTIEVLSSFSCVVVAVKDNLGEPGLKDYCESLSVEYISERKNIGFGANNNFVFDYFSSKMGMTVDDFFCVLNPDVLFDKCFLVSLSESIQCNGFSLSTVCLYKDSGFQYLDFHIRKFPSITDFALSFLFGRNPSIIVERGSDTVFDWSAGSFMIFSVSSYKLVNGFDENYFMYCEDIDICYRLSKSGIRPRLLSDLRAVHFAAHGNRKLFSKHFLWHLKGVVRLMIIRRLLRVPLLSKILKPKSILKFD
mgnify:CR=1 FL=1